MNLRIIGIIQILLSGACFGFLGLFGKKAYENEILPGELLSLRFITSAFLMALFFLIFSRKKFKMTSRGLVSSLLLGILGYAIFSSCYFFALEGLSASLTVLLLYTYPIFVTLASYFIFKERIGKIGWMALIVSFTGLVGLVWGEWEVYAPLFLIYGFSSAVFYAIYVMSSEKLLKNSDPMASSFYIQLSAGITLGLFHFSNWERPYEILNQNSILILSMAFVCSILAMTLFLFGIQKVKSSEASILSTSEPVFGVLIAMLFLNEKMSWIQLLGAVLVITGMVLTALKKPSYS